MAEELRMEIQGLFPSLALAVVRDGTAAVYHDVPPEEVKAEIESSRERCPETLVVLPPTSVAGAMPLGPEPQKERVIRYRPKREALAALGITVGQLVRELRKLRAGEGAVDLAKATIKAPDGGQVPLAALVTAEAVMVERPVVVRRRGEGF